jgi:hypothetical protein
MKHSELAIAVVVEGYCGRSTISRKRDIINSFFATGLLVCGLLAWAGRVAVAADSKGETRAPQGFRLLNGTLLKWGESREDVKLAAGSIPSAEGTLPAVDCDEETRKLFLGNSSEDCLLAADATPKPYGGGGQLMFSKNRFYGVRVTLPPNQFSEAERAISNALGSSPARMTGTVQNGFGAMFDQAEDVWKAGGVYIQLRKRDAEVEEGSLLMYDITFFPKSRPKSASAPF